MSSIHLRYAAPQLDEGLSIVLADGREVGEVRTWNAGGRNAELVELHTERRVLDEADRVCFRWERPLEPSPALAGTQRIQKAFADDLGPTRWYHLSLSRAEAVPSRALLGELGEGVTWGLHLHLHGQAPMAVGYLFRERDGHAGTDHYVMDARYRSPRSAGEQLELRRLDAAPARGDTFARLIAAHDVQAFYYRTPYTWHSTSNVALARAAS